MKNIFLILLLTTVITTVFSQSSKFEISTEQVIIDSYTQSQFDNEEYFTNTNSFSSGIEVFSKTENVRISLNGLSFLASSWSFNNLKPGTYLLQVEREGYRSITRWITLNSNRHIVVKVTLAREFGFLKIESNKKSIERYLDGHKVEENSPIPTGRYTLLIRKFGFEDIEREVLIEDRTIRTEKVILKEVEFNVTSFKVSKKIYNSYGKEGFGRNKFSITVNGPGDGYFIILNSDGNEIHRQSISFTSWDEIKQVDIKLPSGRYSAQVLVNNLIISENFIVDNSLKQGVKPIYNGFSGLVATPTAELNSSRLTQYQFNIGNRVGYDEIGFSFNLLSAIHRSLALNGGIDVELDLNSNVSKFDLLFGALVSREFRLSMLAFNVNYNFNSEVAESEDNIYRHIIKSNIPFTLNLKPIFITLTPGIRYHFVEDLTTLAGFATHYDNQRVRAGLSANINTENFKSYSFEYGAEIHYLLPKTQSYLGLSAILSSDLDLNMGLYFNVLN